MAFRLRPLKDRARMSSSGKARLEATRSKPPNTLALNSQHITREEHPSLEMSTVPDRDKNAMRLPDALHQRMNCRGPLTEMSVDQSPSKQGEIDSCLVGHSSDHFAKSDDCFHSAYSTLSGDPKQELRLQAFDNASLKVDESVSRCGECSYCGRTNAHIGGTALSTIAKQDVADRSSFTTSFSSSSFTAIDHQLPDAPFVPTVETSHFCPPPEERATMNSKIASDEINITTVVEENSEYCAYKEALASNVDATVTLKRIPWRKRARCSPRTQSIEAYGIEEELLPAPAFLLRANEKFYIQLSIRHRQRSDFQVEQLKDVRLLLPDGILVGLKSDIEKVVSDTYVATFLVDPRATDSRLLLARSPLYGKIEDQYVTLVLSFNLLERGKPECCSVGLKHELYVKMAGPHSLMLFSRMENAYKRVSEVIPRPVRKCGNFVASTVQCIFFP